MNILFLTLSRITDIRERGIYTDLLRELKSKGNHVTVVTPSERKFHELTTLVTQDGIDILKVWTLNIQKTNLIEKGIGTILIEYQFFRAINKYLADLKIDLVLYSTPPITLTQIITDIKRKYHSNSYLLLKDIFPQNAVDLGMLKKKGIFYKYFRNKEIKLYNLSDYIGCMSPANVEYVLKHNPFVDSKKVEVCPNSIQVNLNIKADAAHIREKHKIPTTTTLFLYGGNLGKPQGIDFLIKILKDNIDNKKVFFLIIGSGTEYKKLNDWFIINKPGNSKLIESLPKNQYDELIKAADVGLIFLDKRFSIPNFPSRLLSYLENRMPVIIASDNVSDMGRIAEGNSFGLWCESGDLITFNSHLKKFIEEPDIIESMGDAGYNFLKENYSVESAAKIILDHFNV